MRTLSMDTEGSPFHAEHLRTLDALGGGAPEAVLTGCYDASVREAAVHTWRARMVNEHRSSAVFASLVPQLIEASAGIDAQTTVLRAALDEIRHATLCGAVVRAFGGEPRATAEAHVGRMPEHAGLAPLERAVRNVLFVGCLSETVAVGLLTEERELATEPFVREVLTTILADEVAHARLGWLFLGQSVTALPEGARARLGAFLRAAFAYLERRETELLPVTPPLPGELRAQREAAGLCSGEGARALFYETVRAVIVPRLEELGVPAADAWRERAEAPRSA